MREEWMKHVAASRVTGILKPQSVPEKGQEQ